MANRKGLFVGFYVPAELKKRLQEVAGEEHRTLSAECTKRLVDSLRREGRDTSLLADWHGRSGGIGTPQGQQ